MNKVIYEIIDYDSTFGSPEEKIDDCVGTLNSKIIENQGSLYVKTLDENGRVIKHNINYDAEHDELLTEAQELLNSVDESLRKYISFKFMQYEKEEEL